MIQDPGRVAKYEPLEEGDTRLVGGAGIEPATPGFSARCHPFPGTDYWFTITKSGTALTVEIYSTEALWLLGGAGDQDTLSLTLASDASYRYLYAVNSYDYSDGVMDASIANLALSPWKHVCFLTPGKERKGLNITTRKGMARQA